MLFSDQNDDQNGDRVLPKAGDCHIEIQVVEVRVLRKCDHPPLRYEKVFPFIDQYGDEQCDRALPKAGSRLVEIQVVASRVLRRCSSPSRGDAKAVLI